MIEISKDSSILKLCIEHENIKNIMVELGFKDIVKPGMLQSVGRFMTLKKGSDIKKIDFDYMSKIFQKHGFKVV